MSVVAVGMPKPRKPKRPRGQGTVPVVKPQALAKKGSPARYAIDGRPEWPLVNRSRGLMGDEENTLSRLMRSKDKDVAEMAKAALYGEDNYALFMLHDAMLDAGHDPRGDEIHAVRRLMSDTAVASMPSVGTRRAAGHPPLSALTVPSQQRAVAAERDRVAGPLSEREEDRAVESGQQDAVISEFMLSRPAMKSRRKYMAAPADHPDWDFWAAVEVLQRGKRYPSHIRDKFGTAPLHYWLDLLADLQLSDPEEAALLSEDLGVALTYTPRFPPQGRRAGPDRYGDHMLSAHLRHARDLAEQWGGRVGHGETQGWSEGAGTVRSAQTQWLRRQAKGKGRDIESLAESAFGDPAETPLSFDVLGDAYEEAGDDRNAALTRHLRPRLPEKKQKGKRRRKYMAAPANRPQFDWNGREVWGHGYINEDGVPDDHYIDFSESTLDEALARIEQMMADGNEEGARRMAEALGLNLESGAFSPAGQDWEDRRDTFQGSRSATQNLAPEWSKDWAGFYRAAHTGRMARQMGQHPDPTVRQMGQAAFTGTEEDPATFYALTDYLRESGDDQTADKVWNLRPFKQSKRRRKYADFDPQSDSAARTRQFLGDAGPDKGNWGQFFDYNIEEASGSEDGTQQLLARLSRDALAGDLGALGALLDLIDERLAEQYPDGPQDWVGTTRADNQAKRRRDYTTHAGWLSGGGQKPPRPQAPQPTGGSIGGVGQQFPQQQAQQFSKSGRGLTSREGEVAPPSARHDKKSYKALRSPAGGVVVRGINYPGGKFIPASGPEKTTHEKYQQIHRYQRGDGSWDYEAACRDGLVKYRNRGFDIDPQDSALFDVGPSEEETSALRTDLDEIETTDEKNLRLWVANQDAARQRQMAIRGEAMDAADRADARAYWDPIVDQDAPTTPRLRRFSRRRYAQGRPNFFNNDWHDPDNHTWKYLQGDSLAWYGQDIYAMMEYPDDTVRRLAQAAFGDLDFTAVSPLHDRLAELGDERLARSVLHQARLSLRQTDYDDLRAASGLERLEPAYRVARQQVYGLVSPESLPGKPIPVEHGGVPNPPRGQSPGLDAMMQNDLHLLTYEENQRLMQEYNLGHIRDAQR